MVRYAHFRVLILATLCLSACEDSGPTSTGLPPVTSPGATANPLGGARLFAEPVNPALTAAEQWRGLRPADAALLERIGRAPQAFWVGSLQVADAVNAYVSAATAANALPVLVAYNIPQRNCGAGGLPTGDAYLTWIRGFSAGIGNRRAIVILEPDALAGMDCLSAEDRARRTSLIRQAVGILKSNAATYVYIDAGHPRWLSVNEIASRLSAADIARADGFALNVANFISNADNVAYGEAISALVRGKHFVIDTGRNGAGPTSTNEWCNPPGRGLGVTPTTATGHRLVDALLWIKRPGESDGVCNGGPASGRFWPEYALGLAQRATVQVALN